MDHLQERFHEAVQQFWTGRSQAQQKQVEGGRIDAGTRGAVTAGTHMGALEVLVVDLLEEAGLKRLDVKTRTGLELPGYYRPEKKWDLLVVSEGQLVTAIEFKSQVGPSFGNNYNNRVEEAIGNATDIWTAFREQRLGPSRPYLGYFFLLHDDPAVHRPVGASAPYFPVDPIFAGASYAKRYEVLCQRLVYERLYDGACLTLATNATPTQVRHPLPELSFLSFVAKLQGHARAFAASRGV
ncbi:MAG: PaeR7I family type II restriction endonuclease [Chloroflexota bacterium]|nr:PaeR7I family type II restriction endonuclease [Chloroflexota bacterium]